MKLDLKSRFGGHFLYFALPAVHPPPLLDKLKHKQLEVIAFACLLRVKEQKPSLGDLYLLIRFALLDLLVLGAAQRAGIQVQQGHQTHVADVYLHVLVLSALGI